MHPGVTPEITEPAEGSWAMSVDASLAFAVIGRSKGGGGSSQTSVG
jgi:hypothetical protein